ncbi:NAD(P)/FAD-dependent oxidoreductase [Desulfovibrio ferrophilus]|uniref:Sulfite reductase n=1 Tax=Desulfovibrio ferrophilus TaxID=241368 RepID=A0A2Z6B2X9_9BACT|nr:NAD(P)/FAD-dependent oxidoreductase [Desulfovibrio ferrophilus]BBD09857.1 sulfite reductase [Desulfovibrio ferrophilus]
MSKTERTDGAILQRDKETWAIVPRTPMGMLTPEILGRINDVVKKWNVPIVKITSGQRIALVGIREEDIESIWDDLGRDIGRATELCVHYVQACPGTAVCRLGVQDSLGMGNELEPKYLGVDFPAKVKMGVSGCPLSCAESKLRDIGLVGKRGGFTVYFGGNAGNKPRIADEIAVDLEREQALELVDKLLAYYKDNARKRERTARFAERVGIEAIKDAVL